MSKIMLSISQNVTFYVVRGIVLLFLWNWLIPVVFGLPSISIWQAIGFSYLIGILRNSPKGENG